MKQKKIKVKKTEPTRSSLETAKEVRHRSRILFRRHKTVGQVFENKKHKAIKHRKQEELSWDEV